MFTPLLTCPQIIASIHKRDPVNVLFGHGEFHRCSGAGRLLRMGRLKCPIMG
jgi:hypothetical protein